MILRNILLQFFIVKCFSKPLLVHKELSVIEILSLEPKKSNLFILGDLFPLQVYHRWGWKNVPHLLGVPPAGSTG